jgi:hypothetical protein
MRLGICWPVSPLAQRDEQGVELYYNAALRPGHLTADLQIANQH